MSTNELLSADFVDYEAPARKINDQHRSKKEAEGEGDGLALPTAAMSPWMRSSAKRAFDVLCVVSALPVVLPLLLLVSVVVRCTSSGPVLFRQVRMGRNGRTFKILKLRTMVVDAQACGGVVTTSSDARFTSMGPFLRRWKLDELPQLFNVLMGHMSLVGPRPKVPEHQPDRLLCRPGITGAATLVFAHEEQVLDNIPRGELDDFYAAVVLPTKRQIDGDYMMRATFLSDLTLICKSLFGGWQDDLMQAAFRARYVAQCSASLREPAHRAPVRMRVMEASSVEGESL